MTMYPDGSMFRRYDFPCGPLDDDYRLFIEEQISVTGTHMAKLQLVRSGRLLITVRLGISASGVLIFGPIEYRTAAYAGPWLPPLYSFEELVAVLLTSS